MNNNKKTAAGNVDFSQLIPRGYKLEEAGEPRLDFDPSKVEFVLLVKNNEYRVGTVEVHRRVVEMNAKYGLIEAVQLLNNNEVKKPKGPVVFPGTVVVDSEGIRGFVCVDFIKLLSSVHGFIYDWERGQEIYLMHQK